MAVLQYLLSARQSHGVLFCNLAGQGFSMWRLVYVVITHFIPVQDQHCYQILAQSVRLDQQLHSLHRSHLFTMAKKAMKAAAAAAPKKAMKAMKAMKAKKA